MRRVLFLFLFSIADLQAGPGALDPLFLPIEIKLTPNRYDDINLTLQVDGKILIGGFFHSLQGEIRHGIGRLNTDGSLDRTFNPATKTNASVGAIAIQADGRILINSPTLDENGEIVTHVTRLNSDGSLDLSFRTTEFGGEHLFLAPNGDIYVAGWNTYYRDESLGSYRFVLRVNFIGLFDASFHPRIGGFGSAEDGMGRIAVQPDGKVLFAGVFSAPGLFGFARFNPDGQLDTTFKSTDQTSFCNALKVQPDGKILHGFTRSINGTLGFDTYAAVRRFLHDGTVDPSFATNREVVGYVKTVDVQLDGKILAGGGFNTPGSTWHQHVVRFNANGTRDDSLIFGEGTFTETRSGWVSSVVVQPNGKILVAGHFDYPTVDGIRRANLVRLQGDGAFLTKLTNTAGQLNMTWTLADPDRTYHLASSTNLSTWTELSQAPPAATTLQFNTSIDQQPATFLRLTVE